MRLTKDQEKQATIELLDRLVEHPEGLTTTELIGSPGFHGKRTLKPAQLIRLLRKSGCKEYRSELFGVGGSLSGEVLK